AAPAPPRTAAWRYVVAAAVLIALLAASYLFVRMSGRTAPLRTVSLDFVLPENLHMRSIDIPMPSPDGDRIVFSGLNADNNYMLWSRSLHSPVLQQIPGTEGAILPFWSPDGRQIGFLANRKMQRVDIGGGKPQIIAEISNNFGAASWSSKGTILYGN